MNEKRDENAVRPAEGAGAVRGRFTQRRNPNAL